MWNRWWKSGKSPKVGFYRVIILIPKSLVKIVGKYTQVINSSWIFRKCAAFSLSNRRRKCEIFFANAVICTGDSTSKIQRIFEKFANASKCEVFSNISEIQRICEKYFAFATAIRRRKHCAFAKNSQTLRNALYFRNISDKSLKWFISKTKRDRAILAVFHDHLCHSVDFRNHFAFRKICEFFANAKYFSHLRKIRKFFEIRSDFENRLNGTDDHEIQLKSPYLS